MHIPHILRIAELMRVLRIISKGKLFVILSLLAVYTFLVFLLIEVESTNPSAHIKSVEHALWYIVVTLTTVGYGDMYPTTTLGRIIGAVFLISSIGIFGLLIGFISTTIRELQERRKMGYNGTLFEHHIVIIGWDGFAQTVIDCLLPAGRKVAVITNRKEDIDEIYEQFSAESVFVLQSNYEHIQNFTKANIHKASFVFINLPTDTEKLISILNIKHPYPHLKFLVVLNEPRLKETFVSAGVTYILSKNEIAAKLVASYIFEPDVAVFNNDILSHALSSNDYDVQEYKVLASNPFAGKLYGEVFTSIKAQYGCVLIGIVKTHNDQRLLLKVPPDTTLVQAGDYLIFILNGDQAQRIEQLFATKEGV